jgi:hypothetical protein
MQPGEFIMNWKAGFAACALLLSVSLFSQAQYSEPSCEQTGTWRLSDGTIIDTPVEFEVDYMMEMFLACDYEEALDVLGPQGVEPVPINLGGGLIAATCVLRYIHYADPDNQFYSTTVLIPGYNIYNPDPEWYPDDPFHVLNYWLPNWGFGDAGFFESANPSQVPLADIVQEVLGNNGRTEVQFDQITSLHDPDIFHMAASSVAKMDLLPTPI